MTAETARLLAPVEIPLGDLLATVRALGAEAASGPPVLDGQIYLAAVIGDAEGVMVGLSINAHWRRALAAGDPEGVAQALARGVAFAERPGP